jgi:hypothetical protein
MKKHQERCWHTAAEKPFVDRLKMLWQVKTATFENVGKDKSDPGLTPGHKRMAGYP